VRKKKKKKKKNEKRKKKKREKRENSRRKFDIAATKDDPGTWDLNGGKTRISEDSNIRRESNTQCLDVGQNDPEVFGTYLLFKRLNTVTKFFNF
jgi:hypothetical protein